MQLFDDCGCSKKLVTPTMEELLAVARRKPLPTMRVRDRRPPPARVAATMRGWMRWGLIDRCGREVRGGEGPNLITDQGLDQVATQKLKHTSDTAPASGGYFPVIGYCAVGTDNTAPAVTDTALGSEVERTDTTYQADEITRTGDGVYQLTKYIEFDYAEANGNLTEWGFSYDVTGPGLLFNRALFLDGGGSPEVVTKTSDYKLRIIYTLEITLSPVTLTAGAFTVTGVGTVNGDYLLVGGDGSTSLQDTRLSPDLYLFSALARGELGTVSGVGDWPIVASVRAWNADLSATMYSDEIVNAQDSVDLTVARDITAPRDAYVGGSFQRAGGSWKWDTGYGNLDPIRGFVLGGVARLGFVPNAYVAYAFDLDVADEFTKDNEHTLTIGVPTVSWGRGS